MIALFTVVIVVLCNTKYSYQDGLQAIVTVFRHGDKTIDSKFCYPKDPYLNFTYEPYGNGELILKGRLRVVQLGKQLKRRYGKFIENLNISNEMSAISTDYNRTINTLQILLHTLLNNSNSFDVIDPARLYEFKKVTIKSDSVLVLPYLVCSHYKHILSDYLNSKEGQAINNKYQPDFAKIYEITGVNATKFYDLAYLCYCLLHEEEWGLKLPEWYSIYQQFFKNILEDFFTISVAIPELNHLYGGVLLKEILLNMFMKMAGLNEKKLYLYSGHDLTIVGLLGAMKLLYPHHPNYGACIVLEFYDVKKFFFVKVLYSKSSNENFQEMTLPGCTTLCPIEKFKEIVDTNLPSQSYVCNEVKN